MCILSLQLVVIRLNFSYPVYTSLNFGNRSLSSLLLLRQHTLLHGITQCLLQLQNGVSVLYSFQIYFLTCGTLLHLTVQQPGQSLVPLLVPSSQMILLLLISLFFFFNPKLSETVSFFFFFFVTLSSLVFDIMFNDSLTYNRDQTSYM